MTLEKLSGGNSNEVWRDNDTVIRQCGQWSPFVHQLMQFLTENGFNASPRFLETDGVTERLSYIKGQVGHYPLDPSMLSDEIVIEAGKLLRQFHDITQDFIVPTHAQFMLPNLVSAEDDVICHNDFAPYNCVFDHGHIIGIIDFDTVSPGKRMWDIAYAVYRFAPLATDQHCLQSGWRIPPDRSNRLRLFCDGYGLIEREQLIATVLKRLHALIDYMVANASNLEHIPIYQADIQYIEDNQRQFEAALVSTK